MDDQNSPESATLIDLIELVLHGTASAEQLRELEARLLANAEDRRAYLHYVNLHSALKRRFAFAGEEQIPTEIGDEQASKIALRGTKSRLVVWSLASVAAAAVVLAAAFYFQSPDAEQPIAKITGLSGSLEWTGDGGRVLGDLGVGTELPGGTIEGMTPSSWFELEFLDGSTVTISGTSTLTFSDYGQKKLHLKSGKVSANVKPQPASKPMLLYTRSAMLEVVGTQFEVQAGLAATMLSVNQGTVRITRLSDDKKVDVHASQRVVAGVGRDMSPAPVPDSLSYWKSQLHLGPVGGFGQWSPGYDGRGATLRAIPYTLSRGDTIHVVSIDVSLGDNPPVILRPDSYFRIRGRIAAPHEVYFGVTVRHSNGEFAGKFQTIRSATVLEMKEGFEVILPLRDFRLDPSLADAKHRLPTIPFNLVIESIWCHTLYEPAGLEIAEVELLPSEESANSEALAGTASPGMDIWTAASQGNLGVIRGCLAAGGDIDATLSAPGTLASGATLLHLAVLADQRGVVEFLSENGADLRARAKDEHGGTPLHWAAALGRIEMVKLLAASGADVNAPDDHGYTPLDATGYAPEYEREAKVKIADYLRGVGGLTAEEMRTRSTPK
jgi:ferric-dicitrate binding protein FerR (iron transport regulator)